MPPESESDSSGRSPSREGPPVPGNYAAAVSGPRNIFTVAYKHHKGPSLYSPFSSLYNEAVHIVFESRPIPSKEAIHAAIKTFGPLRGCVLLSNPNHRVQVYEALYRTTDAAERALEQGVSIGLNKLPLFRPRPKHASQYDKSGQLKVNLRNLPTGSQEDNEPIKKTLASFGEVELLGFYTNPISGLFEGQGMAIVTPNTFSDKPCRTVRFPEWDNQLVIFAWVGIPPTCNACKIDGHIAKNCPTAAKVACGICNRVGHSINQCPEGQHDHSWEESVAMILTEDELPQNQQQQEQPKEQQSQQATSDITTPQNDNISDRRNSISDLATLSNEAEGMAFDTDPQQQQVEANPTDSTSVEDEGAGTMEGIEAKSVKAGQKRTMDRDSDTESNEIQTTRSGRTTQEPDRYKP